MTNYCQFSKKRKVIYACEYLLNNDGYICGQTGEDLKIFHDINGMKKPRKRKGCSK